MAMNQPATSEVIGYFKSSPGSLEQGCPQRTSSCQPTPILRYMLAATSLLACLLLGVMPTSTLAAQKPEAISLTMHSVNLSPNRKPIERSLAGGKTHSYTIHVEAGQFLHAVAVQIGIDVALTLYSPDGKQVATMDSPNGTLERVS